MPIIRRLFRQGNSVVLSLPADVLDHLGAEYGDQMTLHKRAGRVLHIRKIIPPISPDHPPRIQKNEP